MYLVNAAAMAQLGRIAEAGSEYQKFQTKWPEDWSKTELAHVYRRMCVLTEDDEHWFEGFRKAGLDV